MSGQISFTDIPKVVDATLSAHAGTVDPDLDAVLEADRWAREHAAGQTGRARILSKAPAKAPLARAR
jgi:1-deoxy-D-xylulose 5-phosphate reductoisomerase